MLAFDPRSDEIHEFDLCTGDVFQVSSHPFLVTGPSDDGPLSVVDEYGRSRSIDECEWYVMKKRVVPVMVRHIGAWRFES